MIDILDFDSVEELIAEIERKEKLREENPHLYGIAENFADLDTKINQRPTIQNIRSSKVHISKNHDIFKIINN